MKQQIMIISFLTSICFAQVESQEFQDLSKIKLNSYIENIKAPQYLDVQNSTDKGKADMFWVFLGDKNKPTESELKLQAIDQNKDGKVDLVKHYTNAIINRIETDQDYDGKVDSVSFYDAEGKNIIRRISQAGKSLTQTYWYKSELRLQELDRNLDLKTDMIIHFRDGKSYKVEDDEDYDGKNFKVILK